MLPSKTEPFRFEHPQQQQIHERLLKVGPGAAQLFRDACRIMSLAPQLDATTHLVAHLLRETESCLRDVLLPRDFERPAPCPQCGLRQGTHKKEIEAIADAWGLDKPTKDEWLSLVTGRDGLALHGYAHRKDLSEARPLDKQFTDVLYGMERVFAAVLDRLEAGYLGFLPILDSLLAKQAPSAADVRELRNHVPNSLVILGYFFDNLKDPAWLSLLREQGFFGNPPEPEYDEEQTAVSFARWPQARYLSRMADLEPARGTVAEIIMEIPETENFRVHFDLIGAWLAMPAEASVEWARSEIEWVNRHEAVDPFLFGRLAALISHLAQGGMTQAALELARDLFEVLPPGRATNAQSGSPSTKLRARCDTYEYGEALREVMAPLLAAAGTDALELVCELLTQALVLSPTAGAGDGPNDNSGWWRPAIEDHTQNHSGMLESVLVTAVRDASESLRAEGETVLEILGQQRYKVFWRIGVYLRRQWPAADPEGTAAMVTTPSWLDDGDLHHELHNLLHEQFGDLPLDVKNAYLAIVAQCTPRRQYDKLWPIQECLDGVWLERFNSLRQQFGDPEHPDFEYYSTAFFAGPSSPYNADQMRLMSIDDLVTFLATWEPSGDTMAPSMEGLSRTFAAVVGEDPQRFASGALRLRELDPTYVRALVSGLKKAAEAGLAFDWVPILDLCAWVMDQPREIEGRTGGDRDPNWGWTRRAIAELVAAGLQKGPAVIPTALRAKVWPILEALCQDPEPTPQYEERFGGSNMDPATLSINTVRGAAMHAVVGYALWVRRHGLAVDAEDDVGTLADMPEVRKVLEDHLDPGLDPSPAVHSVYGRWLPDLVYVDSQWVDSSIEAIFPREESMRPLSDAAWLGYITYSGPHAGTYRVLQEEYAHAIEEIGTPHQMMGSLDSADEHLAQHLMVLYWQGVLDFQDPEGLLSRFYAIAPDTLRGYAVSFVGRALGPTTEAVPPEVLARLRALWEYRLGVARSSSTPGDHVAELSAFGWWFVSSSFDDAWSIAQLQEALRLAHRTEPNRAVVERLAELATTMPLQAIGCLRSLIEGDRDGWGVLRWEKRARAIIRTVIGSQDAARRAAIELVHRLGSRGYLDFAELLPPEGRK